MSAPEPVARPSARFLFVVAACYDKRVEVRTGLVDVWGRTMRYVLLVVVGILGWCPTGYALAAGDYEADVKPLLRARCFACHGTLKQEGGLRLDTGELIRRGGDTGPAVVAGDVAKSLLLERVTDEDESARMPPEGEPLTREQIVVLRQWVESGAKSPANERPEEDGRKHWAFQRPVRRALPDHSASDWVRTPVDAFIAARHDQLGVMPNPRAEKHTLLRRLYLDLTGLPPTRTELLAFLQDTSPLAYDRVVERLLNSPQYGERWARHWMDVWRYSDWYGRRKVPDCLNSYGQIWRWRDWIIHSLNADKPYAKMVEQMVAADELAPTDDENIVATGFIVRNFYRWNYNTWMKDNVEHTGKAFLGLTLNCCHCHDHKYDPITNEEYFRFRAFFEPIEIRHDRVPGEPDPGIYPKYSYGKAYKPITSGMVRITDEKLDAETFIYTGGESRNVIPGKPPVQPGTPAVLGGGPLQVARIDLPAESWYPGLKRFVQDEEIAKRQVDLDGRRATLKVAQAALKVAETKLAGTPNGAGAKPGAVTAYQLAERELAAARRTFVVDQTNLKRAELELGAIQARIKADNIRYRSAPGDAEDVGRQANRLAREAAVETHKLELARAIRERDGFAPEDQTDATKAKRAKAVQRVAAAEKAVTSAEAKLAAESSDYPPLSPQYAKQSTGRRAALAKWLASTDNPLTARVAVNHIWRWHFGKAIVGTPENFGRSGDRPTHPQLLDWLSVELMEHGWSMKHIHRLIVLSSTYQQSSRLPRDTTRQFAADRDNVSLWRYPPARVEAEVVRDSILHLSGTSNGTIGGKELAQSDGLTKGRRSIYFDHHGEGRMPFLDLFDAADPCDCYRRSTSVRPQQALAMANSQLALDRGRALADRMNAELGEATDDSFVVAVFLHILSRPPSALELTASLEFLQQQVSLFQRHRSAPKEAAPPDTPRRRARQSFAQALLSHTDFVTIR